MNVKEIVDFLLKFYENDGSMIQRILMARDRYLKDVLEDILKGMEAEISRMRRALFVVPESSSRERKPVMMVFTTGEEYNRKYGHVKKPQGRPNTTGKDWSRQRRWGAKLTLSRHGYIITHNSNVIRYDAATDRQVSLEERHNTLYGFIFIKNNG